MTKQDMELTRLAAKAAGIELEPGTTKIVGSMKTWRPRDDDGDALRLGVKLKIMLDYIEKGDMAGCVVAAASEDVAAYEPYYPNPNAAARLVILRAAAEIGKHLENKK